MTKKNVRKLLLPVNLLQTVSLPCFVKESVCTMKAPSVNVSDCEPFMQLFYTPDCDSTADLRTLRRF